MVKYSIVPNTFLLLYLSIQVGLFRAQYVADVVVHLVSIDSNLDMSQLTGTTAPCPKNVSFIWTRLSAEIIVFSSSSWCSTTGYSSEGTPPTVSFGNGLDRNCSLYSTDFLDFHVSISSLLSCDGNSEIAWPLCTDNPPIAINTSQMTATVVQPICFGSFNIKYSYTLQCRNANSYPPTCSAICYAVNQPDVCYTCMADGTKLCCNSSFGGLNCTAGFTSLQSYTDSTTTPYCPSSCYDNVQPNNLQRTYFISMIFCACIAGILLILVIILCVVCYNHKSVIKIMRDYQNEIRPPENETYRQPSPRQYQPVRNTSQNVRNHNYDDEDERPAYYR